MEIKRLIVGPLQTNCYLVKSGSDIAIIDPGGDTNHILDEVKKLNGKLIYIINTHFHIDHVLGNQAIKRETGVKVLIHEKEKKYLDFSADRWLKDDEEITIGQEKLKVVATPGHTEGSISLLGNDYIFTGDTIFADGFGRTDLDGGSQTAMIESLQKLADIIYRGMKVYPGHGEIYEA